jgi:hypothetical protein
MTVRKLLDALLDHSADGRMLADEVLIKIGAETRPISSSYSDGTFILIAGASLPR